MHKKQTKFKQISPSPLPHPPLVETPKFKDVKFNFEQLKQQVDQLQKIDQQYFSFGGKHEEKKQLQSPRTHKGPSKSVHLDIKDKSRPLNNSFTQESKKLVVSKPQKVQIFNNNYQIINIGQQMDKKDSIRSLQKQFQQILESQISTKKLNSSSAQKVGMQKSSVIQSPQNYFQGQRLKKPATAVKRKF